MSPAEAPVEMPTDGDEPSESKGRIRRGLADGRRLARIAYRDPEHVAERLTLFGSQHLGDPSLEWANEVRRERPDTPRGVIAEEVRTQTAEVARIDGAVSGTPFLIALVPGYLAYLWQEGRMERRIAALYGHDPRDLETDARVLVLRGVHPTVEAARKGLLAVQGTPLPEKPTKRRSLRVWVQSVQALLVFGGLPLRWIRRGTRQVRPLAPEGSARLPRRGCDLDHDLGAARQLHDRDGLGLRESRPIARPAHDELLRRRGRERRGRGGGGRRA